MIRYLTEGEVAEYFGRAHALVLPYRSATGSGVVAIAHHYERPVIVTRVGGLPDVVEDGVTGFVVDPESPEALARASSACDAISTPWRAIAGSRPRSSPGAGSPRRALQAGGVSVMMRGGGCQPGALTGATGFVGGRLVAALLERATSVAVWCARRTRRDVPTTPA